MQIILNCKSQSKDNQTTHCAIEPFHCFRKQPWSEGHRQRKNILCPLFFKLVTTFQNPIWICRTDLYQMNQEMWIWRLSPEWNAGTIQPFKAKKRKILFPTTFYVEFIDPLILRLRINLNIKKKKQIDARGVYLPSQSLKIELCQERLFLYFWDVTPELWRFSLHLLVRGNQPQSAKFIEEMYIKTSLCYN